MGNDGSYQRTQIDILSEPLREVLVELNKDVQGLELTSRSPSVCTCAFILDCAEAHLYEGGHEVLLP